MKRFAPYRPHTSGRAYRPAKARGTIFRTRFAYGRKGDGRRFALGAGATVRNAAKKLRRALMTTLRDAG